VSNPRVPLTQTEIRERERLAQARKERNRLPDDAWVDVEAEEGDDSPEVE